jgi:hypothetical protein
MHSVLVGEPDRIGLPGRHSNRGEVDIKMDFKKKKK